MQAGDVEMLERKLGELRVLYDNYFAGLERREPLRQRDDFAKKLRELATDKRTTQLAFRYSNLRARYATFEAHWNRIAKQIEEGTYKRDKQRAARLAAPEANAPAPAPAAPPGPTPTVAAQDMRQLYESYAAIRQKNKEAQVSYDAMVGSLRKQVPQIIERYKCKSVEFRVVEKDGKAVLKAFPIH
jgi:hypothetical protein